MRSVESASSIKTTSRAAFAQGKSSQLFSADKGLERGCGSIGAQGGEQGSCWLVVSSGNVCAGLASHTLTRWPKCRTDKLCPTGCLPVSPAKGLGLSDSDSRHPHAPRLEASCLTHLRSQNICTSRQLGQGQCTSCLAAGAHSTSLEPSIPICKTRPCKSLSLGS